jgi:hypothetical protein
LGLDVDVTVTWLHPLLAAQAELAAAAKQRLQQLL